MTEMNLTNLAIVIGALIFVAACVAALTPGGEDEAIDVEFPEVEFTDDELV